MTKQQKEALLKKYEEAKDTVNELYNEGSPAIETSRMESKVETYEEVLILLGLLSKKKKLVK